MRFHHFRAALALGLLSLAPPAGAGEGQIDLILSPTATTTISSPGSYVLVANITASTASFDILTIAADNVTLDLNGHTITGVSPSSSQRGIVGAGNNVVIFNGSIVTCRGGIRQTQGSGWTVRRVNSTGCGNAGIDLLAGAVVEDCDSSGNAQGGGAGIHVGEKSTIRRCRVLNNVVTTSSSGVSGIEAGANSTIENNVCSGNTANPNFALTGEGIVAGAGSRIVGNVCAENAAGETGTAIGIDAGDATIISDNILRSNNAGTAYGIKAGSGCLISGNNVQSNNTATFTGTTYGISVQGKCKVERNLCSGNLATGGTCYGIHIASTGNMIDANDLQSNAGASSYGIFVDALDNVIRGNTTIGHTTNGIRINANGASGSACRAERNRVNDLFGAVGSHSLGSGEDANIGF